MVGRVEQQLAQRGIELPSPVAPVGSYVPVAQTGALLFVSGQLPLGPDGLQAVGRCGEGVSIEEGQAAARLCALNILAHVKTSVGDLDKIVRVVKLTGFVNSTADFTDHPKVVNGASDLFAEVLGEAGRHARAAVGVANLPMGAAVEVEAILEVAR